MKWLKDLVMEFQVALGVLFWSWTQHRQQMDAMKCYTKEPEHRKGCKIALGIALGFLLFILLIT